MVERASLTWSQTKTFTLASIRSRYRNTFAGFLWVICSPVLMFCVQGYVFSSVFKINYNNYLLFLACGLLPWLFFSQSLNMGTTLLVQQGRLLKSFPVHPLSCILSQLMDNLLNFSMAFLVILTVLLALKLELHPETLVYFFPAVLSLFIFTVAVVWFLSVLQVFFYDTKFIVDFSLNILFFLTPIVYPAALVPENLRWITLYNPMAIILGPFQALSRSSDIGLISGLLAQSYLVAFSALAFSYLFWKKQKNAMYFRL